MKTNSIIDEYRFVCMDPGVSTGVVIFFPETGYLGHVTVDYRKGLEIFRDVMFDTLVIEQKPKYADWNSELESFYHIITHTTKDTNFLIPGIWKPIAKAQKWNPSMDTQHEKDAYMMLRYFILKEFKLDIGEYDGRA